MELLRPSSLDEAAGALRSGTRALAGGTELVPLLRDGLVSADRLVHLSRVVPKGIHDTAIGAGTTLGELEVDPEIPDVLREACRLAASPQLRNMGTIAGNLLQATRCWYWRLKFPCRLHGGDVCHARQGQHREHAIFANDFCASAHPSDVAAALLALDSTIETNRAAYPIAALYRLPDDQNRDVVDLRRDELITRIHFERPERSAYLKAMDRKRWAFPLVGVAAARYHDGVRLALAGVAPIPWLLDSPADLDRATPLPGTAYKVEIARTLIGRAVEVVSG